MNDDEVFRIAVLGAGPVGLEAALYGRYLGYAVTSYDERNVCAGLDAGEQLLESPFRDHCTSLGLAALDAQNETYEHPAADQMLSVRQWIAEYCWPLSQTDLVAPTLRSGAKVVRIEYQADDETYQLDSENADGSTTSETFDFIVDARFASLCAASAAITQFPASQTEDFFVIGAAGQKLDFRAATDAIRRVYAVIGERDALDVYETLKQFQL